MTVPKEVTDGLHRLFKKQRNKALLDVDLAEPVTELWNRLLEMESNPVRQQQIIELMAVTFGMRMGDDIKTAQFVLHHMFRHARQLLDQFFNFKNEWDAKK